MKRFMLALACVALAISAAGCNTVRGAGKDVEKAGEGIQKSTR